MFDFAIKIKHEYGIEEAIRLIVLILFNNSNIIYSLRLYKLNFLDFPICIEFWRI